jgi:methylated-DNA-[protein]-cysteine S-methyltransferase
MVIERFIESPVGWLRLVGEDHSIVGVHFAKERGTRKKEKSTALDQAERELEEYFAGERTRFTLRLLPEGTEFQRAVWDALVGIPYGETCAYLDIAQQIGKPKAVRAVGRSNGQNPIAIVIPCHRVIGSDGSLTGYGGGMPKKRWLLDHEAAVLAKTKGIKRGTRAIQAPLPLDLAP